jgi:amino acid transporter
LEKLIVAVKFCVLTALAVTGIVFLRPALLSPANYPPANDILFSLAITFFAYEGFRVITNSAEDMPDAKKTLPRAIMTSIVLVMLLYVLVALAVFGHLTSEEVIASKEYALAQAALPVFGRVGFTIVAIAALISTASSINANLYAVTNVTYQLAKTGELPAAFGHRIGHSREGLVISALFVIALTLFFDLSAIAAIGSISILFVHGVTHLGHIGVRRETGAPLSIVISAAVSSFAAMLLAITYVTKTNPSVVWVLATLLATGVLAEIVLQRAFGRYVRSRV